MFCSICGKDCGDYQYCPYCGNEIVVSKSQKEHKESVWSVGQPCPNCGGTQFEKGKCLFCDTQLSVETSPNMQEEEFKLPCAEFQAISSSLQLFEDHCIVTRRFIHKTVTTKIPYDAITSLRYVRVGAVNAMLGFLEFRFEGNKQIPVNTKYMDLNDDPTTIVTNSVSDLLFYHLYYALQVVSAPDLQCDMIVPPVRYIQAINTPIGIDMDAVFERFAPFREQAVKAICEETMLTRTRAVRLVNEFFDARQKQIYGTDPNAAIRDLYTVIGKSTQT